jgi:hypothetical protein
MGWEFCGGILQEQRRLLSSEENASVESNVAEKNFGYVNNASSSKKHNRKDATE